MSTDKEAFKQECITTVELLLKSIATQKADPKNASLKEYLEGYEAGCKVVLDLIKQKGTG